jgi:site-specific DNA-methyltransferase (adenine-specific)/site-specific DNA-methyltransferase (cytosine-N4-specific)
MNTFPATRRLRQNLLLSEPIMEIVHGDAREVLPLLAQESFRCCITSPPYWGLRDYGTRGQIGAEESVTDYVATLRAIFRQVHRLLTPDGTLWLNLGDSYTSGGRAWRDDDQKNAGRAMKYRPATPAGLKPKDLVGVPWRLAFALQEDGWYLRSDIIWHKPNCQPESVKDRPTRSHEYVFLFSKSERYHYNFEAIREPATSRDGPRNKRSVWSINTEPYAGSHFATFPTALVEPCLRAGSERGDQVLDPFFGSGTVGAVCQRFARGFVGVEMKREYVKLAKKRLGWD